MSIRVVMPQLIESKILYVRGEKVLLDKDLAVLYKVKPIALRQQVMRNKERFLEDFMFSSMITRLIFWYHKM